MNIIRFDTIGKLSEDNIVFETKHKYFNKYRLYVEYIFISENYGTLQFIVSGPFLNSNTETYIWLTVEFNIIEKSENSIKIKINDKKESHTSIFTSMAFFCKTILNNENFINLNVYYISRLEKLLKPYIPFIFDNFIGAKPIKETSWLNASFYDIRQLISEKNLIKKIFEYYFYEKDYILLAPEVKAEKKGKYIDIYFTDKLFFKR